MDASGGDRVTSLDAPMILQAAAGAISLWGGVEILMIVGVSDKPFGTDDIDDEGVEAILRVDFLQDTEMPLDFGY